MKTRRWMKASPWVEELEPRVVLSSPTSLAHQVASIATVSTNWSGYAAQTNLNSPANNAVTMVSGSWVVPAVTGSGTSYSSFWVGIDGYSSNTVEQIGTDSDLQNGVPTYYAWYEMYPNPSYNEPLTLSGKTIAILPGQTINASVSFNTTTSVYTLSLTDVTTGAAYSTQQKLAGAKNSSAEWVAEAPSSGNGILPLSNFGTVSFSKASATINGVTGPIDNTANASINMVSGRNNSVIAATSALTDSSGTSSFTVTYHASTTPTPAPSPPSSRHHRGGGGFGWHSPDAAFLQDGSDAVPGTNASAMVDFATRQATNAAAFGVPQQNPTLQQAAARLDAPALSPVLAVITLGGPGGVSANDAADEFDNADPISIWLPAELTTTRGAPNSVVEFATTQLSRPTLLADAAPMQILYGVHARDVFAEPVPAPTPTPSPEQRAESAGNLVARTLSKALCLVGVVGFIAQATLAGRSRQNDARNEETDIC